MPPMPPTQQPTMDQMPGAGQDMMANDTDAPGSTELCISVAADGSLSVYKESGGEESEQESQRQPAADIGQALALVLKLYKGLDQQAASSQFDAGFGSQPEAPSGGNPMGGSPMNARAGGWK